MPVEFKPEELERGNGLAEEISIKFKQRDPRELIRQTLEDLSEEPEFPAARLKELPQDCTEDILGAELLRVSAWDHRLALEYAEQTWQAYDWKEE
jgi:hypothetical protein